ncbi:MAG: hypothetical protein KIT11_08405 [Fimbriimonadaceae bacterium]|nr:hypothetical protein [Fimbriimonadaceae bacterium]QYK56374.1 MAG: hypothetical protein KF733_02600 [Fimbriimonadaceae bacterium]
MDLPELIRTAAPVGWAVVSGLVVLGLALAVLIVTRTFRRICGPNEALIVSGFMSGSRMDGRRRGYRPIIGGYCWAIPALTKIDRLSLTLMEVPISVRNAYSRGGIPMNIDAIANVKISSDERVFSNAVERFVGRDPGEIRRVAKETLEGHLRGVVATLTPEQVNEDRLVFAEALARETEEDLAKLGLHLDTLKILHVGDEVAYLDATGRKAIANVVREATIAESDSKRNAEQAEAEAIGRAKVVAAECQAKAARLKNELRTIQADLKSRVDSEEERTTAAAREARAKAEQKLQEVRSQLETLRLQADQVLPSEAARQAEEFKARGRAALIRERGRAVSEALDLLHEAWSKAGPSAKQIAVIEDLEKLIQAAVDGVKRIEVQSLNVIDSGDGRTLPNYIAAYPEMLGSVFEAIEKTTGIDIPATVRGKEGGK